MKRVLFLAISLGFFLGDWLGRLIRLVMGMKMPATAVVLYYHSIPKEKRSAFARQMDELVRWSKPIAADIRGSLRGGSRYVAVTFDDGLQNNIDNALPELIQRGIPATFFVVTGALGGTPNWRKYRGDSNEHEPIMTAEQVEQLPSDLIEIGSHTRTHPMLTQLSEEEARFEISESRWRLREITHSEVKLFCFPYGDFNDNLIAWCREEGYERVFTSLPYLAFTGSDEFVVGRIVAEPDDWPLEFRLKLFGAYRWLQFASSLKKRVLSRMTLRLPIKEFSR
jgi:peptidoglycan/xylan/chitin deacetylase (PgdA/CDA1 family)